VEPLGFTRRGDYLLLVGELGTQRDTTIAPSLSIHSQESIPMTRITSIVSLVAFAILPAPRLVFAQAAKLAVTTAKPPAEIAEPIRAELDEKVLRIATEDKATFEFWFRKELPLAEKPAGGTLGLTTMKEGAILGVARVAGEHYDFRNEEIKPGLYTVRLGIQPEDGNHLGVAPTRTFALLIPAKQDKKLDPIEHDALMKAAAAINAAKHPSNLNLQPVEKTDGEFPRLEERNGGEHKVVLLKLPAVVSSSKERTTLTFALVYDGLGTI
jgi:hypothetical protein